MDGLIVENFGSSPFKKGTSGHRLFPHEVALMARAVLAIKEKYALPVGVNCLRNDAMSAMGVAAATGAEFIRVNIHIGAFITDQGMIEGEAHLTLRYREQLEQEVAILADVLVKHAVPVAPVDTGMTVRDCLARGRADGIIVTGSQTGSGPDLSMIKEVNDAAGESPVYLGSGLNPENAPDLLPWVDGAIVGTWVKEEGLVHNPVDQNRVDLLVKTAALHLGRER
jgi:hypothetical protein